MIFSSQVWGDVSLIHSMLHLILLVQSNDEKSKLTFRAICVFWVQRESVPKPAVTNRINYFLSFSL